MWRPWRKSSVKIHNTFSPTASFKDIHHLCTDDSSPFPSSPCASPSPSPNHVSRVFHRVCAANLILRSWPTRPSNNNLLRADSEPIHRSNPEPDPKQSKTSEPDAIRISIPGAESSIVVYFTSLRVVRPTFEACRAVTAILRSFPVRIDERDLSMDASFAAELERIFAVGGEKDFPKTPKLPRVFIGGRYVGGAEEVKQLHEIGELKKLVQELPRVEPGTCGTCGGHRFVPCDACHGSHKVYTEKLGFRTCSACNENGLVRCSSCSFPHFTA
ncbi:Glutaredoxin domain-containing protein [Hirschfeldia incana]|nr:Glutaredoxin domain-containing protein [Hirschfeldia incana]